MNTHKGNRVTGLSSGLEYNFHFTILYAEMRAS